MAVYISSDRDLRNWIDDHIDWPITGAELDALRDKIQSIDHRPIWGTDWSEFLANLDLEALGS